MSHDLLSAWLNIPETQWPPDYYTLLGFAPGAAATEDIEQRVLERMEKLRHYQLMHPEQVTEGMNLLAQAMIKLTDPRSRRDYDRQIGLDAPELDQAAETLEEIPIVRGDEALESLPPPPKPSRVIQPISLAAPLTKSAAADTEPAIDSILIPELIDEEPLPLPPEEEDLERESPPGLPEARPRRTKPPRRRIYADLARIRAVLRVWEKLRIFLDDPVKTFARRTEAVSFMSSLADLRPLLPTVADLIGAANQPGSLIAALSRQQLIMEMFRSLLPSQLEALARDCQAAHYILLERYSSLRRQIRLQTAKGFYRGVVHPFCREMIGRPEWIVLAVALAALVIAFARSLPS